MDNEPIEPVEDIQMPKTDSQPTEEEPKSEQSPKVKIGDAEYDPEELAELVSKGSDYTRKTQELAEQRRRVEEYAKVADFFESLPPEKQQAALKALQTAVMDQPQPAEPEKRYSEKLRESQYEDDIVEAFSYVEQQNAQLRQQMAEIMRVIPEVKAFVQETKGDAEARAAAEQLKAEFKVDVSPSELRKLQKETGIQDMEAAWLKANKEGLIKGAFRQGHREGQKARPLTPTGESKAFRVEQDTSPEEILNAINAGMEIVTD